MSGAAFLSFLGGAALARTFRVHLDDPAARRNWDLTCDSSPNYGVRSGFEM